MQKRSWSANGKSHHKISRYHVRLVNVPIQNIHTRSIEDDPITDISLIDGDVRIPPVHEEGLVGDSDVQF